MMVVVDKNSFNGGGVNEMKWYSLLAARSPSAV